MQYYKKPTNDKRPGILEAVETICSRFVTGKNSAAIFLPPRYGKSTVIRAAAYELTNGMGASSAFMVAPWVALRRQILCAKSATDDFNRYNLPKGSPKFEVHEEKRASDTKFYLGDNGPLNLISMTMGLLVHNKQIVIDTVGNLHDATGCRVPLFFDESQLAKINKRYGDILDELILNGAFVIALTGTPWTSDSSELFGFRWEATSDWTEEKGACVHSREEVDGKAFATLTKSEWRKQSGTWRGDCEVSYKEAFKCGALNKMNFIWIDPQIENKTKSLKKPLSKVNLDNGDFKDFSFSDIIQQSAVIDQGCQALVERLKMWKKRSNGKAKALIVTGKDEARNIEDENMSEFYNRHAREIKRVLGTMAPIDWSIEIATSVDETGESDKSVSQKIERFRDGGGADILIVKMMGLVGLDAPHLKTQLYMSPIRTGPLVAQGLTRTCTEWPEYAGLSDVIMMDYKPFREYVEGIFAGGFIDGTIAKDKVSKSEKIKVEEPEDRDVMRCDFGETNFGDNDGDYKEGEKDALMMLRWVRDNCPDLSTVTDPKVIRLCMDGVIKLPGNWNESSEPGAVVFENNDSLLESARKTFNSESKMVTSSLIKKCRKGTQFGQVLSKIVSKTKREAGIVTPLGDCRSISKIERATESMLSVGLDVIKEFSK